MITVTCTEKLRDKNNRIVGYELQDCNGKKMRFTSEQVKQAIFLQQLTVKNLKLTSDGSGSSRENRGNAGANSGTVGGGNLQ